LSGDEPAGHLSLGGSERTALANADRGNRYPPG